MCNVKEIGVNEVLDLMTETKEELLQDDPHCIPCEGRDFFKGYYVGRITALFCLLKKLGVMTSDEVKEQEEKVKEEIQKAMR